VIRASTALLGAVPGPFRRLLPARSSAPAPTGSDRLDEPGNSAPRLAGGRKAQVTLRVEALNTRAVPQHLTATQAGRVLEEFAVLLGASVSDQSIITRCLVMLQIRCVA
jgi:hypothetical protein